jgi:uncharacterized protein (TIGR03435 family)
MMRFAAAVVFTMLSAGNAGGQLSPEPVAFEVVAIKPVPADGKPRSIGFAGGPGIGDPARFEGRNVSLMNMLFRAFDVDAYQIVGPAWLEIDRFDFSAKVPNGATRQQLPLMLQQMLKDRFGLVSHADVRSMDVYRLVVARNGPKLRQTHYSAAPDSSGGSGTGANPLVDNEGFPILPPDRKRTMTLMTNGRPHMTTIGKSMDELISLVRGQLDRPVQNGTNLPGEYDFKLTWILSDGPGGAAPKTDATAAADAEGLTLFEALDRQLGLKLEKTKGRVDVLVIDRLNRMPTAN